MKLSVIILSYNTKKLLEDCLDSVYRSLITDRRSPNTVPIKSRIPPALPRVLGAIGIDEVGNHRSPVTETIVVDNASSDGSPAMVSEKFPWVKLIKNPHNYGFSKGNNLGIKRARGKYILLLNSDTKVFPRTLRVMVGFMEKNPDVGLSTCRVELSDGSLDPACHRGFPTPWNAFTYFLGLERFFPRSRLFAGYHLGWLDLKKTHEIETPSGAFYFIRREVLDQVGFLDEDFFMYGEDIDFSYRVKKGGWKIMFVPQTKITHYKKKSGRKKEEQGRLTRKAKKIREKTIGYFFETMKLFYDRHYKTKYSLVVRFLVLAGVWLLTQIKLLKLKMKKV